MNNSSLPATPFGFAPFEKIIVDREVHDSPLTRKILQKLPRIPVVLLDPDQTEKESAEPGNSLVIYLKHYKGRFLRPCPGTKHYRCCAYQIIHTGENCPLGCSYCILQAYFQDRVIKVWANQNDLWKELDQTFGRDRGRLFRVGTGEFNDSLALEYLTGYAADLVTFLNDHPNVCLELKSKIIDLTWMKQVKRPDRVLPAWSVNSPEIIAREEHGASCLEDRLQAARKCAQAGFRACLHFDPVIHYPGWEKGYARAVEMIFSYLNPKDIAYISMGSFRFMPALKKIIKDNHPESKYIFNEFITGLDNKSRLVLPLRLEQFRFITGLLRQGGISRQLYFCMESDMVWKQVLGYTPSDLGGLGSHLLKLGFNDLKQAI
ncbi:SPL family radical SAM protein [Desulfonatronovibrio hydrogenovorans]|uniref:SPL family radical SAM protein n=1 Tax=Desulfonatronovibrio hydrogenovorans TaxID=53245 RepID=UPI00068EDDD7|nr:radical SAM protein [Desulfonatronovibrio hydrogenovorans]